jgi:hypothetical protein
MEQFLGVLELLHLFDGHILLIHLGVVDLGSTQWGLCHGTTSCPSCRTSKPSSHNVSHRINNFVDVRASSTPKDSKPVDHVSTFSLRHAVFVALLSFIVVSRCFNSIILPNHPNIPRPSGWSSRNDCCLYIQTTPITARSINHSWRKDYEGSVEPLPSCGFYWIWILWPRNWCDFLLVQVKLTLFRLTLCFSYSKVQLFRDGGRRRF